jgi:hypothetical protein
MFFDTVNNIYPLHQGDLELTGWQNGDDLPTGWVKVLETPIPEMQENVVLELGTPIKKDNVWYQTWNFIELSEQKLKELEQQRAEREAKRFNPPDLME